MPVCAALGKWCSWHGLCGDWACSPVMVVIGLQESLGR